MWIFRSFIVNVTYAVASVAAFSAASAIAQTYPVKPIRLIAPFPPGGTTDILARITAQKLGEAVGQQVIVDNRGGGGGTIGVEAAARSAPDGYTILIAHIGPLAMAPALYPKLGYDPVKDFAPITLLATVPNGLVVHPSVPARSVKDLIALARAKPNQVLYASAGNGSIAHLAVVNLELLARVSLHHVPYKGGAPSVRELIAGETSLTITGLPQLRPHVEAGRLRLLAIGEATCGRHAAHAPASVQRYPPSDWNSAPSSRAHSPRRWAITPIPGLWSTRCSQRPARTCQHRWPTASAKRSAPSGLVYPMNAARCSNSSAASRLRARRRPCFMSRRSVLKPESTPVMRLFSPTRISSTKRRA